MDPHLVPHVLKVEHRGFCCGSSCWYSMTLCAFDTHSGFMRSRFHMNQQTFPRIFFVLYFFFSLFWNSIPFLPSLVLQLNTTFAMLSHDGGSVHTARLEAQFRFPFQIFFRPHFCSRCISIVTFFRLLCEHDWAQQVWECMCRGHSRLKSTWRPVSGGVARYDIKLSAWTVLTHIPQNHVKIMLKPWNCRCHEENNANSHFEVELIHSVLNHQQSSTDQWEIPDFSLNRSLILTSPCNSVTSLKKKKIQITTTAWSN